MGSAVVALSRRDFLAYPVPPPTVERRTVVTLLDAIEERTEINRQANETLEAMAQAIFRDWFVDFGPTRAKMQSLPPYLAPEIWSRFPDRLDDEAKPEGWGLQRIEDLLDLAYGKALPATSRVPGEYPVYGSGGITGHHVAPLLQPPAVIVGRKGTVGSLYWEDRPCFPIDTVFYIVPKRVPLTFCYYLLRCLGLEGMNTDAAVPGLNRNNVYRLQGSWGVASLSSNFDAIVGPMRNRIFAADQESRTLSAIRDLLLPKLMSSEIRVKDAEKIVEAVL